VNERLRRLLVVVPAARARPGISVQELARQLDCSVQELRQDLDLLPLVGSPPFCPDDLVEIDVQNDRVYVRLAQSFERPTRLSATEAAALAAAARLLAPGDPVLHGAVEKLARAVSPAQKALYEALLRRFAEAPADAPEDVARSVDRAISLHRELEILYFARTELAARARVVQPRATATVDGVRYLSARNEAGAERMYRLDRIARATVRERRFPPLPETDLSEAARRVASLESCTELPRATVRFAPAAAAAARARHAGATALPDGGADASVAYTSLPWLVSYVLSWGGEAEIAAPEPARRALREAVERAMAAHRKDEE